MRIYIILCKLIIIQMMSFSIMGKVTHKCNHDETFYYEQTKEQTDKINRMLAKRKLEQAEPKPIRITYDADLLDDISNGPSMTQEKKNYILKIVKAAQMYLTKLIKVIPRSKPITGCIDTCAGIQYPPYLRPYGSGAKDTDLHLIISYYEYKESSALANAGFCELGPGPIIGRIKFNIATMQMDGGHNQFLDNFTVSLHELIHVLGFTKYAYKNWIDPDTNQTYEDQNISKVRDLVDDQDKYQRIKLKTKNIVKTARQYFNCPSIDGMFMENQGGNGSADSHWERDLLANEFMTATQVEYAGVISEFTASLLRDTGYYAEINSNMVGEIYWGKDKGCDFFENTCNSNIKYDEFEDKNGTVISKCVFDGFGAGSVSTETFSQCYKVNLYTHGFCGDGEENQSGNNFRTLKGIGSKCFNSTLRKINTGFHDYRQYRCFQTQCSEDYKTITVTIGGGEQFTCKTPSEIIDFTKFSTQTVGIVNCPSNFKQFCTYPNFCKNNCSSNGICLNGYCMCLEGYAGEDCSVKCAAPNVLDGAHCISKCSYGSYKNPDNSCKTTCPRGYYKDKSGECLLCHRFCSSCVGPNSNECDSCNMGYSLSNKTCIVGCDFTCKTCSVPDNPKGCTDCKDGFYLTSSNSCQSCHPSCKTCSQTNNANSCKSCKDGFYLNGGSCLSCSSPCKTCILSNSKIMCTSCVSNTDYSYDSSNNLCSPICHSSCKNCSQPNNNSSCLSCIDGYYLDGTTCKQCEKPCIKCENSSTQCTQCEQNYILNQQQCVPQCDFSCATCSKPQDKTACMSCRSECFKCTSPCQECQTTQSKCTKCIDSYKLNGQICEPSCHFSCETCDKFLSESNCNSCSNGKYLETQGVGKCLQCKFPCKECKSSLICDKCADGYKNVNGSCQMICDSSCQTCSSSYDPKSCLSCNPPLILQENTCINCKDGEYYINQKCKSCIQNCKKCSNNTECTECNQGYILNEKKQCEVEQSCHYTCKECIGKDYYTCTSCAENRELKVINNKYGVCECPQNTSDTGEQTCESSNIQKSMKSIIISTMSASIVSTSILSKQFNIELTFNIKRKIFFQLINLQILTQPILIISLLNINFLQNNFSNIIGISNKDIQSCQDRIEQRVILFFEKIKTIITLNPVLLFGLIEFNQNVSYLGYINQKQPLGFDEITGILSYSHFTQIIKASDLDRNNQNRLLNQEEQNQKEKAEIKYENVKLKLNNKTNYFLLNALCLLIVQGAAWLLSIIFYKLNQYKPINVTIKLKKYFYISIPIVLFALCSQEQWLLIFYQFYNLNFDTDLEIMSFILFILTAIYMIAFLAYLFYKLEYKKCIKQDSVKSQNQVHSMHQITDHASGQELAANLEIFYFISQYVRQDKFLTRNLVQFIIMQKIIISCVSTCITQSPLSQIIIIIICKVTMILYLGIFKPFKQKIHTISLIFIYIIVAAINIIYSISISYENNPSSAMSISLVMMILIICVFIGVLSYSLIIITKFIQSYLKGFINKDIKIYNKQIPQLPLKSSKEESILSFQIPEPISQNQISQLASGNLYFNQSQQQVKIM